MQRRSRAVVIGGAVAATAAALGVAASVNGAAPEPVFSDPTTIDNRYLPLTTHRRCVMRGSADGTRQRSVKTLLERTRRFDVHGRLVDAAIIRDDAYENGRLVERTLDYFAQADDGTVYYLGEDVDNIRRGRVVNHKGSWLFGRDTDVPGVAMPTAPKLGEQFRLEDVPGITTESDRVEELGLRVRVHGRLFTDVIRIQEFVQPEGEIEYKLYAPGVGSIVEYEPEGRVAFAGCR